MHKLDSTELLLRAATFRQVAANTRSDALAIMALELAEEYEAQARQLTDEPPGEAEPI